MKLKLKPKTPHAIDILNKHGEIFKVNQKNGKSFRIASLKKTNYFPFVGWTEYKFFLQKQDNHFEYEVVK